MNEQYSRCECLAISDVPESVTNKNLEGKVLKLLEKIDAKAHPDPIETCHWIKSNAGPKKVIIKISRRKDADKIRMAKKTKN